MAYFAKTAQVAIVLFTSVILSACSSNHSKHMTTNDRYISGKNVYAAVYNSGMDLIYYMPERERAEHVACTDFSLTHSNPGESCEWTTIYGAGIVRVSAIDPNACHYLMHTIRYKGKTKSWQDQACPMRDGTWKFR